MFNIIHYTVYYNSTNDIRSINFISTATNGIINGLTNATSYVFRISATYEVSSDIYREGPLSPSVSPSMPLMQTVTSFHDSYALLYIIILVHVFCFATYNYYHLY